MTRNRSGATPQSLADKLIAPRTINIRDARRAGEVLLRTYYREAKGRAYASGSFGPVVVSYSFIY